MTVTPADETDALLAGVEEVNEELGYGHEFTIKPLSNLDDHVAECIHCAQSYDSAPSFKKYGKYCPYGSG